MEFIKAKTILAKVKYSNEWYGIDYNMNLYIRDRSMITISALMAQGLFPQVKSHLILGKEHGLTKEECVEIVTQLAFYAGWAKAWNVFPMIEEIYGGNEK